MSSRLSPLVSRNDLSALLNEAQTFSTRYNHARAAEILQRARKLEPDNEKLLVELGAAYTKAYDFTSAEKVFAEAIRVAPKKAEALNAVAHCWMEVRHFEAAKNCLEKLLEQKPVPLIAYIRLSEIYTRMRRLDDAAAMADKGAKVYSTHEAAWLIRAKVHRQAKELQKAESTLRFLLSKTQADPQVRSGAYYELGAVLDQQGQYDEAWQCFLEAKNLMGRGAGQCLQICKRKQDSMREMTKSASGELVQKWRKMGAHELQPPRRMALLGGHARSGTTLLEYILDSHPQVVSADETSVFHNVAYFPLGSHVTKNSSFTSVLDWLSAREIRQIRSEYFRGIESFLGEAVGQKIGDRFLIDKNPANMFDIPALLRIFPESKYLIPIRDPRDVVLSCFTQPVNIIPDTSAWLTLEGTMTHYAHIMGLWQAWKPHMGDMAIEVRYEQLVDDLEGSARRVLEFLKLPWDDRVLKFHEHTQGKIVRSPTFAEVGKPVYKTAVARWRNYQKYFEPHLKILEPFVKAFGYEG